MNLRRTLSRWNILAEPCAHKIVCFQQIKRKAVNQCLNLTDYEREVLKSQVNLNLNPEK